MFDVLNTTAQNVNILIQKVKVSKASRLTMKYRNRGKDLLLKDWQMSKNHTNTYYCSDVFCHRMTCNSFHLLKLVLEIF